MNKTEHQSTELTPEEKQELRKGIRLLGEMVLPIIRKYCRQKRAHDFIKEEEVARLREYREVASDSSRRTEIKGVLERFIHVDAFHVLFDVAKLRIERGASTAIELEINGEDAEDLIRTILEALKGGDHGNDDDTIH